MLLHGCHHHEIRKRAASISSRVAHSRTGLRAASYDHRDRAECHCGAGDDRTQEEPNQDRALQRNRHAAALKMNEKTVLAMLRIVAWLRRRREQCR